MLENIAKWGVNMKAKTFFKTGLNARSKALSSEIGKKLIDAGIKHAPELYALRASTIRNENVRAALDSDVPNYISKSNTKKVKEDLNNPFGGM